MQKNYKVVVFVPINDADKIREVLSGAGAGHIGNYDSASFSSRGIGRFRPLEGATPAVGKIGQVEEVDEVRIEALVSEADLEEVCFQLRKAHPYEEPAIDVYQLHDACSR